MAEQLSPKTAYQVTIAALNSVWKAVRDAADAWQKNTKMTNSIATASVQAALGRAAEEIGNVRDSLSKEETGAINLLSDIVERLNTYKSELVAGVVKKPSDLLGTWRISLKNILTDIVKASPEVVETPAYQTLEEASTG